MNVRRFNWSIWAGFLLSLIAFFSYFFVFVWFPVTRDFPWANLLLFALAAALLLIGVRRAFAPDRGPQRGIPAGVVDRGPQRGIPAGVVDRGPQRDIPAGVVDRPRPRRSKIAAVILATLSIAIFGFFVFSIFIGARRLPASRGAPQVGQPAPDFTLSDTNGKPVSLSELLTSPVNGNAPNGVLLIFYRGYW